MSERVNTADLRRAWDAADEYDQRVWAIDWAEILLDEIDRLNAQDDRHAALVARVQALADRWDA